MDTRENLCGSGEINTAFQQRFFSLALVVFNIHTIIVVTLNKKSNVDSLDSGRYTALAAAKSAAGCGSPEFTIAHNRAYAVFLCAKHCHISTMVGRAGQPQGWPGSMVTGTSTPVRLTTNKCGSFGGELSKFTIEAAIMATIPPRFIFIFRAVRKNDPDTSFVFLHSRANTERLARKPHEHFYDLQLVHCSCRSKSKRPRIIREVP
ncbi:ash family protein [Erwinia mallotivora]|uniref:ash family protein n=1 Tax=Erwinia mallotivora TaxID=69222 RepID=UPI0035F0F64A